MRVARERGAPRWRSRNIMGSQPTREADGVLYTRGGREIGVAATKTFTAQVMALHAARAASSGRLRGRSRPAGALDLRRRAAPRARVLEAYLASTPRSRSTTVAASVRRRPFFLYIGRHLGMPVCLEGALKLKEISYIPTDAYPAGEMKHGPIALLDEGTPVVVVATDGHVYDKVVSNIQEVRARGARVIAVATEGNEEIAQHADDVLWAPRTPALLSPIAARRFPLQILAYGTRAGARPERRPAAQPRQDRHRRVEAERMPIIGVGVDIMEIDRFAASLAKRPRLAERCFTPAEAAYCASRGLPAPAFRRPFRREGGRGQGARHRHDALARGGGGARPRRPTIALHGLYAAARPSSSAWSSIHISLTHGRDAAVALAVAEGLTRGRGPARAHLRGFAAT